MPEEVSNENQTGNTSTISELAQMVETLKKEREASEKVIAEYKEIISRNLLGGVTNNAPAPKPVEETAKDYAKRILSGKK